MRRRIVLALIGLGLMACSEQLTDPDEGPTPQGTVTPFPAPATPTDWVEAPSEAVWAGPSDEPVELTPPPFVVHEWGTFTSLQSSDGRTMEGLHHTDEPLPEFVYARNQDGDFKGMELFPYGVTQKLETPVLYFYSDRARSVSVDVGFPRGVISEWYPNATSWAPALGEAQGIADGQMRWDVLVEPGPAEHVPVSVDDIWAPSRQVDATPVRLGDETEQFIFYRGLGAFETPFRVDSATLEQVVVSNPSDEEIPAVFLIRVHDEGAGISELGPIPALSDLTFVPSPKERSLDAYIPEAQELLAEALVRTGLYEDEAWAMVRTWAHSYFRTPGLRLLYIVPRSWTDELLPITISPTPDSLVRTMVGRVEVMTEDEEQALVEELEGLSDFDEGMALLDQLGRFAEPRLRRAHDLLESEQARAICASLIETVTFMP